MADFCTGFVVEGRGSNKEEAWSNFDADLAAKLSERTDGHKYWRVTPLYEVDRDFRTDEVKHRVIARVTYTSHAFPDLTEVSLSKPYPSKIELSEVRI